jgi:hypothetical protein
MSTRHHSSGHSRTRFSPPLGAVSPFFRLYCVSFSSQVYPPADMRLSARLPPLELTPSYVLESSGLWLVFIFIFSYPYFIELTYRLILYVTPLNANLEIESKRAVVL